MAPAESQQDWDEGGGEGEVDLEYLIEAEHRGRRAEEYAEVDGDSGIQSPSSDLDLLSMYFARIGKIPLQSRNQEFRTAVTATAVRLFRQWKEHPESGKSANIWEELLIQLFRSWDAIRSYCAIQKVDPPDMRQLLVDAAEVPLSLHGVESIPLQEYLRSQGWGRGEEGNEAESGESEKPDSLEQLTKPLFTFFYAAVLLPTPLMLFIREKMKGQEHLPDWREVRKVLDTCSPGLLTAHEEQILLHGKEARALLILSNMRFAVERAKKYRERGVDFEDLIQDANLGLIRATDTFEPHRGNRFSTHAGWKMKGSLSDGIEHEGRIVRLKGNTAQEIAQLEEAKRIFQEVRGREPTLEELSTILGKSIEVIQRIQQASRQGITSLDATVEAEEGESASLLERLEAKVSDPSERAHQLALKEILDEVLKTLEARERTIVILRHGLENGPPYTLEQVAAIMDVTRERIRQLETQGEAKIIRKIAERFPHLLPEGMEKTFALKIADQRDYSKRNKRRKIT